METVLSWVKQIFILSILSTVVTHLMPSAKYTKYASYICGLLIVMVCIQPLAAVFHGGISLDKIYESVMTYNQSTRLKQELTYREGDSAQSVMEAYEKPWKNMYWKMVITLPKQQLRWRKTRTAKTMERYAAYQWFYRRKKNSRFQLNRLLSEKAQNKKSRKYRRITVNCEMNWHSF